MNGIEIKHKPVGRQGTIQITIVTPGETYTDKLDVTKEAARRKFLDRVGERISSSVSESVAPELEKIAASVAEVNAADQGDRSQADELVELARDAELFHSPGGYDSEGYASIEVSGHRETWPIGSSAFRRWLAKLQYEISGKTPGSSALDDALTILSGKAIYDGAEMDVAIRLAGAGGKIYLDLGDAFWQVVEVAPSGWRVIAAESCPVRFVRRRGMYALPVPTTAGRVDDLRPLVNIKDDKSWMLLVGCLVGYLRPTGPYPILLFDGEQGSAKSTTCRLCARIIDPRKAVLRRPPKSARDLMVAASNSWIVSFDNLSGIDPWLSDTICTLSTGGGFAARELYSDGDEKLFDAMRPVIMNGIDSISSRSDLLDRAVRLHLPKIPNGERKLESEIYGHFEAVLPGVLGALLRAVAAALAREEAIKLDVMPRMADFARWVVAAESELGWRSGAFLAAYMENRAEGDRAAVEASSIGRVILKLVEGDGAWTGTCTELLRDLEALADSLDREGGDWPRSVEALGRALRRVAPNLRALGLVIDLEGRTGERRVICIARGEYCGDGSPEKSDSSGGENCHRKTGPGEGENPDRDGSDGNDGFPGPFPVEECEWSA